MHRKKGRKSTKSSAPKTRPVRSHSRPDRQKMSRAKSEMTMSQLHDMARSIGVAFGGLNKEQLIRVINRYKL